MSTRTPLPTVNERDTENVSAGMTFLPSVCALFITGVGHPGGFIGGDVGGGGAVRLQKPSYTESPSPCHFWHPCMARGNPPLLGLPLGRHSACTQALLRWGMLFLPPPKATPGPFFFLRRLAALRLSTLQSLPSRAFSGPVCASVPPPPGLV